MKRILTMTAALALAACGGEDLEWRAEAAPPAAPGAAVDAPAPDQAAPDQRRVVYLDVRQPDEFAAGHVKGAIHIPHTEMSERLSELEEYRDAHIVLYCRTGRRSGIAEQILHQAGFEQLHNGGGLSDLERQGIPTTR